MPANEESSYRIVVDRTADEGIEKADEGMESCSTIGRGSINDYFDVLRFIGKGGFATVYHGKDRKRGTEVAIKEIDIDGASEEDRHSVDAEITAIKSMRHKHIVTFIESYKFDKKVYIILEYAALGSIRQFYLTKGKVSEEESIHFGRQIALGLQHLHSCKIAHRDVKCANCLLTEGNVVKLSDFGSSKQINTDSVTRGLKGTPHWMAPEVIKGIQMRDGWLNADIWSFGCTLVEMLTGKFPYAEYEVFVAMYKIANGETPRIRDLEVSDALRDLLTRCCSILPSERPFCAEILSSKAMGGDDELYNDNDTNAHHTTKNGSIHDETDFDILGIFTNLEINNKDKKAAVRKAPTVIKMGSMTTALKLRQSESIDTTLVVAESRQAAPLKKNGSLAPIYHVPSSSSSSSKARSSVASQRRPLLGALVLGGMRESVPPPIKRTRSAGSGKYAMLPSLSADTSADTSRKIKSAPATSKSLHCLDGLRKNTNIL